jgi:hypothetical protein
MAFDKEELQQLEALFQKQRDDLIDKMDDQRIGIMSDVRSLLQPIKDDLAYLKQEIREVKKMAVEDVEQAFGENDRLKKK